MACVGAGGKLTFRLLRSGAANPSREVSALAMLLERNELVALLAWNGLDAGFRTATYSVLVDRIAASIPARKVAASVREILKRRVASQQSSPCSAFGRSAIICSRP